METYHFVGPGVGDAVGAEEGLFVGDAVRSVLGSADGDPEKIDGEEVASTSPSAPEMTTSNMVVGTNVSGITATSTITCNRMKSMTLSCTWDPSSDCL